CFDLNIDVNRLFKWADSLLILPEVEGNITHVPFRCECKGFNLHPYQRKAAAWSAHRMGTVSALGCGVGKTATAIASAATAVANGNCSNERVFVVCPLNATGTWNGYLEELEKTFKEVRIVSRDSMHKYQYLDRKPG